MEKRLKMDREERRKFWLLKPEDIIKQKQEKQTKAKRLEKDKLNKGKGKKDYEDTKIAKVEDFDAIELTKFNIDKKMTEIASGRA